MRKSTYAVAASVRRRRPPTAFSKGMPIGEAAFEMPRRRNAHTGE
jgi:hypothetical protein